LESSALSYRAADVPPNHEPSDLRTYEPPSLRTLEPVVVAARTADDLTSIYEQLAADVTTLYRVGYVPSRLLRDGAWYQVQVYRAASGQPVTTCRFVRLRCSAMAMANNTSPATSEIIPA
jgi:hypothetical protein